MNEWRKNAENNDSKYGYKRSKSVNSNPSNHTDNGYQEAFNSYALDPAVYYKMAKNCNESLYYASRFNDMPYINTFKKDITDPNIYYYDNDYDYDMCPLTYAVLNDNIELFKFLLSFENINVNVKIDDEPLVHLLFKQNKLNYLKLLLSHRNLDLNIENKQGETALYIAVEYFYNNPKEYLYIIETIIDKTNPKKFKTKSIIEFALKKIEPHYSLLLVLYNYDKKKFPDGTYQNKVMQQLKEYVKKRADLRMRAAFYTYVTKHLKEKGPNHGILSYLTNGRPLRPKSSKVYKNAAALKVASRKSFNTLMPYLSETNVTRTKKK